ncbi:hypothetical protein [Streptomyces sp. NPDC014685]|uniref:hypothetical protein n=1 Tax=Streptomyces sp. NPDC014685 TaxID=3364881 RepID=UPI0036F73415
MAVTLLAAPPLETPMEVKGVGKRVSVRAGDTLVATVSSAGRAPWAVPPVDLTTARIAARRFPGRTEHPFPTCFACGPRRTDGLHLTPGSVPGRPHTVACPWTPRTDDPDMLWCVLDCPGGWVDGRPAPQVLSRLSVVVPGRIEPDTPHVVVAERLGAHGRTVSVGSSVHTASGHLVATAAAVWTAVPDGLRHSH